MRIKSIEIWKWSATTFTILSASLLSFNSPYNKYAFLIGTCACWCWLVAGIKMKEPSIWVLNIFFAFLYVFAIYNWFFRG